MAPNNGLRAAVARLRDEGEHQWIVMDGCGHCYLCGQTLHMPAHELPEFGCLSLPDQLQKVADNAGTFARSTIALLLASAAKALTDLLAQYPPETAPTPLAMDGTIVTPEYVEANRDLVETPEEIARLRGIMEKWAPKPGVTLNFMRLCDSHEAMRRRYETRVCATCIHDRYRPECGQRVVRPNNVDFMREGGSRDTFGCPLHAPAEPMPSGYVQSASRGDASRAGTCATCVKRLHLVGTPFVFASAEHHGKFLCDYLLRPVSPAFGCNQWAGADAPKEETDGN